MKKGDKRGPYNKTLKSAATKKNSLPSAASTAMFAAFVASGNNPQAQDGHDDGGLAAAAGVDDKCKTRANDEGANWPLALQLADTRGTFPLDHDHNSSA